MAISDNQQPLRSIATAGHRGVPPAAQRIVNQQCFENQSDAQDNRVANTQTARRDGNWRQSTDAAVEEGKETNPRDTSKRRRERQSRNNRDTSENNHDNRDTSEEQP